MKISDLTNIRPANPFRFVRSYTSDIVHILVAYGDHESRIIGSAITRCNRVIQHGSPENRYGHTYFTREHCQRCGTEAEFIAIEDALKVHKAEYERQRDLDREMKNAELVVQQHWTNFGAAMDEGIMDHIAKLVDAGNVLVPFSKSGLAFLRMMLRRYLNYAEKQESKNEAFVATWYQATDMLEFLESYGD